MFRLAYNTNGLAHHRLADALPMLARLGYEGVAITPDAGVLDPLEAGAARDSDVQRIRALAEELGLALSIETGARYLLDAERKHWPSLLEPGRSDRERRFEFLARSVDLAAALDAPLVSVWSGVAPGGAIGDRPEALAGGHGDVAGTHAALWDRLCDGVTRLVEHGGRQGVRIAFEPEPGMFLERPAGYLELVRRLGSAGRELWLTLDVGHCLCTGDLPVAAVIRAHASRLAHVHLDDGRAGKHEHLMFGEGELDLAGTLDALVKNGFDGLAAVELSRDSHRGAWAAAEAMQHLRKALAARPSGAR